MSCGLRGRNDKRGMERNKSNEANVAELWRYEGQFFLPRRKRKKKRALMYVRRGEEGKAGEEFANFIVSKQTII